MDKPKPNLLEIELQEGSPFTVEMLDGGGLRVRLPKAAVERALLLQGTSYPVLVEKAAEEEVQLKPGWYPISEPIDGAKFREAMKQLATVCEPMPEGTVSVDLPAPGLAPEEELPERDPVDGRERPPQT